MLVINDQSNYFQSHAFVIGSHVVSSVFIHQKFNANVLVTLQFTHDHSDQENTILLNELKVFLSSADTKINPVGESLTTWNTFSLLNDINSIELYSNSDNLTSFFE